MSCLFEWHQPADANGLADLPAGPGSFIIKQFKPFSEKYLPRGAATSLGSPLLSAASFTNSKTNLRANLDCPYQSCEQRAEVKHYILTAILLSSLPSFSRLNIMGKHWDFARWSCRTAILALGWYRECCHNTSYCWPLLLSNFDDLVKDFI